MMSALELTILLKHYKLPEDFIKVIIARSYSANAKKLSEQQHTIKLLRRKISNAQRSLKESRVAEHRRNERARRHFIRTMSRVHVSADEWKQIITDYMDGYKLTDISKKYHVTRGLLMRLLQVDYHYDDQAHVLSVNGKTIKRKPVRKMSFKPKKPVAKKPTPNVNSQPEPSLADVIKSHTESGYNDNVVVKHVSKG